MYRKIFNFAATIITLLSANLLTSWIADKLISYKWEVKPLRFTLISMGIIAVVFYPLFTWLQKWLDRVSRKFVKAGHNLAGKYIGLFLMAVLGLFILMCFYAHMWYGINVLKMVFSGTFFKAF
jgi:mannitol-specific phosphotransferase system IIBC component